ncbi:MAG: universal stress protein [Alphaproteobacteria bacterium]|nr:universal stress protein [Alphaproteobacteria bacterium]
MAEPATSSSDGRIFLVVVDDTPELRVALRFASRRAKSTGGRVAMLYVIEPADFQHWAAVENLMEQERRQEAEEILQKHSEMVQEWSGSMPMLYVRDGRPQDALLALLEEEPGISILVLGADTGPKGPGPLVSACAGKLAGKLRTPVTIVPGSLDDDEVDALT